MASSSQVVQPIAACSSSAAWQSTQQDCRAHLSADPAAGRPPARVCASLEKAKAMPREAPRVPGTGTANRSIRET